MAFVSYALLLLPGFAYATSSGENEWPLPAPTSSCQAMAAAWQINVAPVTASPQLTGTSITYRLQIQCSAIAANSCVNSEIRFPAQAPTTFETSLPVSSIPVVEAFYFDAVTMEWVIDLVDVIAAGSSLEIDINALVPTNTTPDGTSFVVDATIDADNTDPDNDSEPGAWTASADLAVAKYLQFGPGADALLDRPVIYYISPCSNSAQLNDIPGNLWIENWTITDTLPADVVFVSASNDGVYDPGSNSVTWSDPGVLENGRCIFTGATDYAVEVIYPSTIFGADAVPPRPIVSNQATFSGYPFGAEQIPGNLLTDDDEISHGFTEAGAGLGSSKSATTPYYNVRDVTFEDGEGIFDVDIRTRSSSSLPYFFRVVDPLPCLENNTTAGTTANTYTSNAPGVTCANPAFQPDDFIEIYLSEQYSTMLSTAAFIADNPTVPLRYTATDGSMGVLNLPYDRVGRVLPGIPGDFAIYKISWADVMATIGAGLELAELTFNSQDVGLQIEVTPQNNAIAFRIRLSGTVTPTTAAFPIERDDRLVNIAQYFITTDDGETDAGTRSAQLFIEARRPAIRLLKDNNTSRGRITLNARSVGTPFLDQDSLILTDLLPLGYTFDRAGDRQMTLCNERDWRWLENGGDANLTDCTELDVQSIRNFINFEVINNYNGTGRQLVRVTFLPPPLPDVWATLINLRFAFYVNEVPMTLGADNEVRFFPTSQESSDSLLCQPDAFAGPAPASTNDMDDQDGDGLTTGDSFCSFTRPIPPTTGLLSVSSVKAVKGDDPIDQDFQPFPAVAPITEAGGNGAFQINMTNTGSVSLADLVIYDVLPHVGDVGLTETQLGTMRGSEFDITFVRIDQATLPPGAQVEYSFSNTPCRDELTTGTTPFPTGCVNDWTTVIPAADSNLVRGLRITFPNGPLQPFDPTESLSIEYAVTYPAGVMPGETAWNVFAFAGTRTDDNTTILPTEPPKVGIGVPLIDLSIRKSSAYRDVFVDQPVRYTIVVDHLGDVSDDGIYTAPFGTATNVTVMDDFLAQGLTIVPGSSAILRSSDNGDGGATFDETTGEWIIPRIEPNDVYTLTYYAFSDTEGSTTNTAEITTHNEEDIDSTPGNGDDTEDDIDDATVNWFIPGIDLQKQVETSAGSGVYINADASDGLTGSYREGEPINYRYIITNTGSVLLRGVTLTDDLLGTECNTNIGNLNVGQSQTIDCIWPFGFPFSEDQVVNVANVSGWVTGGGIRDTLMAIDSAIILTDIIYDLALTKTLVGSGPFYPGSEVMFTINVFNQGTNTAYDIDVADYFDPTELSTPILEGLPNGVTDNGDGTFTIDSILSSGQFSFIMGATIPITFPGTEITNNAEITGGGATIGGLNEADVDSSVGNNANDAPESDNDNEILDGDTGETIDDDPDEDDFDPVTFPVEQVFDLALRKTLVSPTIGIPGQTVTFRIEVFNQGTVAATDLTVIDYLPTGTQLADVNWTDNMDNTASFLIGNLAIGATEMVEITLLLDSDVMGLTLTNYAEIASVNNAMELEDQDSAPGNNQGVDESGTNNDIDDEFPGTPGDEDNDSDNDDYDLAVIPLCDIQLIAGSPQTTCSNGTILLAGSISPTGTPGVWLSDGDGVFSEDEAGTMLSTIFGQAIYYVPGTGDQERGTLTLTLTSGGACPAELDTLEITILPVDCGDFPWDGGR